MKQSIKILGRGVNSRRFRKLNSVTELVGKDVEVSDNLGVIEGEVESVSVDKSGDATVVLDEGTEIVLDPSQVNDLIEEGEVVEEVPDVEEPEANSEYEVTREVLDSEGNPEDVTTTVEAGNEGEALQTVTLLDSRRGRNSRNYRAKLKNSDTEKPENPEPEKTEEEMKEFKVVRVADCDGAKVRKIASVTAESLDEAIEAVKAKDTESGIVAEGYSELVEKTNSKVTINSDVDEVIKEAVEKAVEKEVKEPENPEPENPEDKKEPEKTEEKEPENPEEKKEPEKTEEEMEHETNSFKGVQEFVKRKYGINF